MTATPTTLSSCFIRLGSCKKAVVENERAYLATAPTDKGDSGTENGTVALAIGLKGDAPSESVAVTA
jgi:hypothetical protein